MGRRCSYVVKHKAVIQAHFGNMLECGRSWTHAAIFPCAHQKNLQPTSVGHQRIDRFLKGGGGSNPEDEVSRWACI